MIITTISTRPDSKSYLNRGEIRIKYKEEDSAIERLICVDFQYDLETKTPTVNVSATGSINKNVMRKLVEAMKLAHKIASGEVKFST